MALIKLSKKHINTLINENKKVILNERTSSIIYHWCSTKNAVEIGKENQFRLMSTLFKGAESDLIGTSHKHMYYMSMTRNGKIGQGGYNNSGGHRVRLTLDGDLLNSNFHIKALDYWGKSMGKNSRYSDAAQDGTKIKKPGTETEAEDRLYYNKPFIENAQAYIKHVDIYYDLDKDVPMSIRNLVGLFGKRCTIYKTIEDFNSSKNPIDRDVFYDLYYNKAYNNSDSDVLFSKKMPIEFLATVVFLVNFPFGTFNDSMNTLREYGLGKYSAKVAKYLKNPHGWNNPFVYNILKLRNINKNYLYSILKELFGNLTVANDAQELDKKEISQAYKILTDFCAKHKVNNYKELKQYFVDTVFKARKVQSGQWDSTMDITCIKLENDDEISICVNPSICKYADVFRNGKDLLKWIAYDILHGVENHKSPNANSFKKYIYNLLIKSNPTVQDVIDLYDRLEQLGNNIDQSYKPQLLTKTINYYQLSTLFDDDYSYRDYSRCYDINDTSLYLFDNSQKDMLYDMWESKYKTK